MNRPPRILSMSIPEFLVTTAGVALTIWAVGLVMFGEWAL